MSWKPRSVGSARVIVDSVFLEALSTASDGLNDGDKDVVDVMTLTVLVDNTLG